MKYAVITASITSGFLVMEYGDASQRHVNTITAFKTRELAKIFCTEERLLILPPSHFVPFDRNDYNAHSETKDRDAKILKLLSVHPFCKMISEWVANNSGESSTESFDACFISDENGIRLEMNSWTTSMIGIATTSRKVGIMMEEVLVKALRFGSFTSVTDLGFELVQQ